MYDSYPSWRVPTSVESCVDDNYLFCPSVVASHNDKKKSLLTDLSTPFSLKAFLSLSRNLTSLFFRFTPRSRVCKLLLGQRVKCWVPWSSKQVFQKQISKGYETSVISLYNGPFLYHQHKKWTALVSVANVTLLSLVCAWQPCILTHFSVAFPPVMTDHRWQQVTYDGLEGLSHLIGGVFHSNLREHVSKGRNGMCGELNGNVIPQLTVGMDWPISGASLILDIVTDKSFLKVQFHFNTAKCLIRNIQHAHVH